MNLLNNLEDWGQVPGPFEFSNLLQLLSNQLCQDSSIPYSIFHNKMSNIKNGQILLYCHFNKIIKGWPGD